MMTRLETSDGNGFVEIEPTNSGCRVVVRSAIKLGDENPGSFAWQVESSLQADSVVVGLREFLRMASAHLTDKESGVEEVHICDGLIKARIRIDGPLITSVGKVWCEFSFDGSPRGTAALLLSLDMTVIDAFLENSLWQ